MAKELCDRLPFMDACILVTVIDFSVFGKLVILRGNQLYDHRFAMEGEHNGNI